MSFAALFAAWMSAASASDPDAWVDAALTDHPALVAVEARTEAAASRAEVAGRWPDLVASLSYTGPFSTGWIGDHPMAGIDARLTQRMQPPAWSRERREAAASLVDATAAEAEIRRQALAIALREGWWTLAELDARRDVLQQHTTLLAQALESAQARLAVGQASQASVLRLELRAQQLQDDLAALAQDRAALTARLAAVARQPLPEEGPHLPDAPPRPSPSSPPEAPPSILRQAALAQAAEAAAEVAHTERGVPVDVFVGVRGRTFQSATDPGVDLFTAGIAVPLPTTRLARSDGQEAAARAEARAWEAEAQAEADRIAADTAAWLTAWSRQVDAIHTLDTLRLPTGHTLYETVLQAFQTGRASGQDLYEAERDLLDMELERLHAVAEALRLRARIAARWGVRPEELGR